MSLSSHAPVQEPLTEKSGRPTRSWTLFFERVMQVQLLELDTTLAPKTVDLQTVTGRNVLIKDAGGLAGTNNITVTGTVDGVVNPVINTNYGSLWIYWNGSKWLTLVQS